MFPLSPPTRDRLRVLFAEKHQAEAERLLAEGCAENLPFSSEATPESLERIRFAVLKLSAGNLGRLRAQIREAAVDWRDVLMAADFGTSVTAHEAWRPTGLFQSLDALEPFLDAECRSWRRCTEEEHGALLGAWRAVYPRALEAGVGGRGAVRAKHGPRAMEELGRVREGKWVLVQLRDPSQPRRTSGRIAYECESEGIPDLVALSHHIDFFIAPADMSWTVVYTHETDEFGGPSFARRDWMRGIIP